MTNKQRDMNILAVQVELAEAKKHIALITSKMPELAEMFEALNAEHGGLRPSEMFAWTSIKNAVLNKAG